MTTTERDELLTVGEVVAMLRVHEQTVRRWLRDGEMRGILLSHKSGYRIRASEVERFLAERENKPAPARLAS